MATGMPMMKSKMNNHLHAERPWTPSIPLYRAAWRYPENICPMIEDTTKSADRLPISLLRYQDPRIHKMPGQAELSKNPMKNWGECLSETMRASSQNRDSP